MNDSDEPQAPGPEGADRDKRGSTGGEAHDPARDSAEIQAARRENADIESAAREMALRFPEVELVYLFGSRACGHTGPLSDYDLSVHLNRTADVVRADDFGRVSAEAGVECLRSELYEVAREALPGLHVDLTILNGVPVELAYNVISTGRIVFERSTAARVEYEAYVLSRYGDYLPVLRRQREDLLRENVGQKRIQRYRESLAGLSAQSASGASKRRRDGC